MRGFLFPPPLERSLECSESPCPPVVGRGERELLLFVEIAEVVVEFSVRADEVWTGLCKLS